MFAILLFNIWDYGFNESFTILAKTRIFDIISVQTHRLCNLCTANQILWICDILWGNLAAHRPCPDLWPTTCHVCTYLLYRGKLPKSHGTGEVGTIERADELKGELMINKKTDCTTCTATDKMMKVLEAETATQKPPNTIWAEHRKAVTLVVSTLKKKEVMEKAILFISDRIQSSQSIVQWRLDCSQKNYSLHL